MTTEQQTADRATTLPLAGVRIIDISNVFSLPYAGGLLADLGAEVIKVERVGAGDDTRGWGPPFVAAADGGVCSELRRQVSLRARARAAGGRAVARAGAGRAHGRCGAAGLGVAR